MCLAVPMKITSVSADKQTGTAEFDGIEREANFMLIKNPRVGDYVIIHAGFAIEKFNERAAKEQLKLFKEITDAAAVKRP